MDGRELTKSWSSSRSILTLALSSFLWAWSLRRFWCRSATTKLSSSIFWTKYWRRPSGSLDEPGPVGAESSATVAAISSWLREAYLDLDLLEKLRSDESKNQYTFARAMNWQISCSPALRPELKNWELFQITRNFLTCPKRTKTSKYSRYRRTIVIL